MHIGDGFDAIMYSRTYTNPVGVNSIGFLIKCGPISSTGLSGTRNQG